MRGTDRRAVAGVLALSALAFAACHSRSGAPGADAPMFTEDHGLLTTPAGSPLRSHLVVAPVGSAGGAGALDLPAAVEADPARVANILSPLTGRIVALKVGVGQRVKQGQVLAVIASGDYAQARADDEKARDAAAFAKKALDRARGVREAGGSANKDLEAAESAYAQAEAELSRAEARLQSLGGSVGGPGAGRSRDLILTAPQAGVVTTLAIGAGAEVDDPTAVLMTVTNLDRVFVTANVAETDVGQARVGSDATIVLTADPAHPIHAKVSQVNAAIEPDTRRQKIRIALSNPDGRLLPGMYAAVRLAGPAAGGVVVPQSALLMNNDTTSVLVEVRPWTFQRRPVQIGDETETSAHVISGLQPGERVVVRGGVLLND
jgi:cobalt-zinc-cadmium efflux system membrane fusion protein